MRTASYFILIAFMLGSRIAAGQSPCLCANPNDAFFADSSTVEFGFYGYQCIGLKGKEWRAVDKCLGLPSGNPLLLGPAFRRKLCTCSPARVCFTRLEITESKGRNKYPILYIHFKEP